MNSGTFKTCPTKFDWRLAEHLEAWLAFVERWTLGAAFVAVDQTHVIEPHQVQQRRMEVEVIDDILHGFVTELIGLTVNVSGLDASASEP